MPHDRIAPVDVAVASAHVTLCAAQIRTSAFQYAFAPGAATGLFADEGVIHILSLGKEDGFTRCYGFVTPTEEYPAEYLAGLVERRNFGVKGASHQHGFVCAARRFLQVASVHVVYFTLYGEANQVETEAIERKKLVY